MIPRQRPADWKQAKEHPDWCVVQPHDRWSRHRSETFTIGQRRHGGEVTAWLEQYPGRPTRIGLNAAYMQGLMVDISVTDARTLAEGLARLCDQA